MLNKWGKKKGKFGYIFQKVQQQQKKGKVNSKQMLGGRITTIIKTMMKGVIARRGVMREINKKQK
jgi:hypothetical protein